MICILGCLDNPLGLSICDEMLKWLSTEHEVFVVHQDPPGYEFEYPAILKVLQTACVLNKPVLYLHTKGAGNPIPSCYKERMMAPGVIYPQSAKPEDCQRVVRQMWEHEFTGKRLQEYLKVIDTDIPTVACPFTGKERLTWQNGWIINPAGAKELLKTFHKDTNRYYYECMFQNTNIEIKALISNNCHLSEPYHKTLWNLIWIYYKE